MPTYNKPGVYIEETLTTNQQVVSGAANSTAAFIGVSDRGPTALNASNGVVGVPTLVTSWSEFVSKFSFGSVVTPFTTTVNSASADLKYAVKSFFENGGSQAYITRLVNKDAVKATKTFNTTATGTAPALTITAKSHGAWGNNVWASVTANTNPSFFDIYVYYSETATSSNDITYSVNHVEHFVQLTMDPTNARYALNAVTSDYIALVHPTANSANTLPYTSTTKYQLTSGADGTDTPYVSGTDVNGDDVLSQLDSVIGPLVLNWPKNAFALPLGVTNKAIAWTSPATTGTATLTVGSQHNFVSGDTVTVAGVSSPFNGTFVLTGTASATISYTVATNAAVVSTTATGTVTGGTDMKGIVNAQFDYASARGDIFVVVDAPDTTVSLVNSTISGYNTTANYGAAYYPYIYVADPVSRVGGTKKIAPGGAVAAMYVKADAQKGPFQSPAGIGTKIVNAVSVPALTNSDFNAISNNAVALNVIRFIPGSGICVMGARTLTQGTTDNYVAVRRSLIYLNKSLSNLTQFAVFEANDTVLWSRVRSVVDSFLYGYWRKGGLKGVNTTEAYYVKCDSTNNTQSSIDAGELHIEVGVALQKPAEFVIIKIGQMDGGTTVTIQG